MRTATTLSRLLLNARRPGESRNAQAIRMGFSEGALRFYEHGGLPNTNTIPALARALGAGEAKLRQIIERERHAAAGSTVVADPQATLAEGAQ